MAANRRKVNTLNCSAVCFMEIYSGYHKSCSTYICVYNNIIKNSLSKALKHIRAPAPSPSAFSSQKLRRSQKKTNMTDICIGAW